jgi:cold-inducible RNA-binding protein
LTTKLYVGNLSYDVDDKQLAELFNEYGTVTSAQVIFDRNIGQSRGFGFVEMSNESEAQTAINGANGKSISGRPLTVNESRPRESSGGGGGGGSRRY